MNTQTPKKLFDSVSSKSNQPLFKEFQASNIFGGRKSSFDYVNLSKESDQLIQKDFRNSFDVLMSNINNTNFNGHFKNIIQLYNNDQNKAKIQHTGFIPISMQEVNSDSEEIIDLPQNFPIRVQPIKYEDPMKSSADTYDRYFPQDLAKLLKDRRIPLNYVRSLLKIRKLEQIKSTRRLKVQRYLQKRRKKTWNRKICYNCRQKVAQERLRIKGKFIKKRRAMEILGIKTPIEMVTLKQNLQILLKDKTLQQVDMILKCEEGNE